MGSLSILHGVRGSLATLLLVWFAQWSGALDAFDEIAYDAALALVGKPRGESRVLLVEIEPDRTPDWERLQANLAAAGASALVLLETPPATALASLAAAGGPALMLGQPISEDPEQPGEWHLATPASALPAGMAVGGLAVLAERTGLVRRQLASLELAAGRQLPAIETLVAAHAGIEAPQATYWINLAHGLARPRLPARTVEAAPPLKELVAGRVALIGAARAPQRAEMRVPGGGTGPGLTALEFHGLATDTLLRGLAVGNPGPAGLALILAALTGLLLLVFQPLEGRLALGTAAALGAALLLGILALFRGFDLWLPPLPGMLLLTAVPVAVFRDKASASQQQFQGLLQLATAQLQHRVLPAGFAESPEHWAYVINLVDQTLLLNRSIFLERTPGDHRVREIQALRCSISDISEMRRDFERAPYTSAMEQRGTISLNPERPFLRPTDAGERQFLAPLVFAGEVLGFWAFGVLPDKIDNDPQFIATADRLSEHIALLLYQRRIWLRQSQEEGWRRYLADDTSAAMGELGRAVTALEQRVRGFEEVFASLHTAAAYYDLFGRVVLINRRMSERLADWGLGPYEMTAVDLICALTGRPPDEVRDAVRKLVFDRQTLMLDVVREGRRQHHLLHVRPLHDPERDAAISKHGILLEMVDIAEVQHAMELKADALRHLFREIGGRLAEVARDAGHADASLEQLVPRLHDSAALLRRADRLVEQELVGDNVLALYPVRLAPLVEAAVVAAGKQLAERELRVELGGEEAGLVFAEPEVLRRLLGQIIALLCSDALSNSEIDFTVGGDESMVVLDCSNSGFGIPDERLQALLSPLSETHEGLWAELRAAPRLLARWGGDCRLSSRIGAGFRVELRLRRFR